jgi:hypothetical protein
MGSQGAIPGCFCVDTYGIIEYNKIKTTFYTIRRYIDESAAGEA